MVKTLRFAIASLILLTLSATAAFAQGEAGASSLIIPPSARANGMGQSFVAIADDATAIWWNPAGIAFVDRAVDLMHTQLVPDLASDVFFDYIGGVYSLEGIGTIGAALLYLTYGDYEVTRLDPNPVGTASAWEVAPTLSGAVKIFDTIGIGMNVKYVYVSLAPDWATIEGQEGKGHSVAIDFGALWKIPDFSVGGFMVRNLNLGFAVTNLGPSITYVDSDQAADLPRNMRLGFAYTPVANEFGTLTVAADYNRPMVEFERSSTYHAGAEFVYAQLFAARGGYIHDKDGDIKDATYGLGFILNKRVRFDWSTVPQSSDLGRVHRWSLGVTF
ncbi:MAG: PorV/PorQ family protein [Candidatus Krumholzibacteriota bacterium]|nr:PorV/PorQ family protein [Candidatus Krumholzibacteriota bacterium]